MKDYEDEAFDDLEKSLQRKVATGVTDGSKLGTDEVLRVMPDGEFIWHPEADAMIETIDFSRSPAMPHILRVLRKSEKKDAALRLALEALRKSMQGNLVFTEAIEAFKAIDEALGDK